MKYRAKNSFPTAAVGMMYVHICPISKCLFFLQLTDNGILQSVHPLYVRLIPKAELESKKEVRDLFPAIPAEVYELVAGNHRAFVHSAWWYVHSHILITNAITNYFIVRV